MASGKIQKIPEMPTVPIYFSDEGTHPATAAPSTFNNGLTIIYGASNSSYNSLPYPTILNFKYMGRFFQQAVSYQGKAYVRSSGSDSSWSAWIALN